MSEIVGTKKKEQEAKYIVLITLYSFPKTDAFTDFLETVFQSIDNFI